MYYVHVYYVILVSCYIGLRLKLATLCIAIFLRPLQLHKLVSIKNKKKTKKKQCVQNFKRQISTLQSTPAAPVSAVEQRNSSQEQLLSFSDWGETADCDDGGNECEPLLARQ